MVCGIRFGSQLPTLTEEIEHIVFLLLFFYSIKQKITKNACHTLGVVVASKSRCAKKCRQENQNKKQYNRRTI